MSTKKNLGKLERVSLREAWSHEASEFTPWLAETENLNVLADTLGLSELVLVNTEHRVGDFKLDILCTDGEEPVIIENQLDETDHKHFGQILAYAAGVGAKKVIWIAESFRPEHVAALKFLNENTTDELSFFGVQIELWRIGGSPLAPKFEVVTRPDNWTKTGREQARTASTGSPRKQLQQQFWTALVERLSRVAPQIRPQAPQPRHWLNNSIGRSGFALNPSTNSREERLGVELYIKGPDAKKHFAEISSQKQNIEQKLGFTLDWQELPEAEACRIASWFPDAPIDDEERWEEYLVWLSERLVKMDQVLRPIVKALP